MDIYMYVYVVRVYNYTKTKGLDYGKIMSLLKQPKRDQLGGSLQSSLKILNSA